ncbi:sulfotransferase family protein [Thalassotalea mangrovi]|uniref:Sulfotransferase n=1 Tax=Thalassotalea mangrovi TaxID=2572245 RepID=A0A4U1B7P6_9GAMM|nr:sulfotransferase [Thalassotalea mangrovi]TKB46643.1 sulfotransferase [Thalassotalea mangrovi]
MDKSAGTSDDFAKRLSPVFIVGCPRSGTTLLQVKLSAIEELAIPPEDDFILRFYYKLKQDCERILTDQEVNHLIDDLFYHDNGTFSQWHVSREQINQELATRKDITLRQLIDAIYQAFLNRLENKQRWGCKVPYFAAHIETLQHIFPFAKFIHIVRDGRAAYQSMLEREQHPDARQYPKSPFNIAWQWQRFVNSAESAGQKFSPQFLRIHYENLLADADAVYAQLATFLDVKVSQLTQDYYQNLLDNQLIRQDNIALYVKPKIDASKAQRWQKHLSPYQLACFEAVAGNTLQHMGYPLSKPPIFMLRQWTIRALAQGYLSLRSCKQWLRNTLLQPGI